VLYDLYRIGADNIFGDCDNLGGNLGALGADVAGIFIPGVTGLGVASRVAKGAAPKRIYSARELKRRADSPKVNNVPNPNHNFPESFNSDIFKGTKTKVSDNYTLYTKPGNINGRSGTFEIGVKPSASGKTEVITHRFFRPDKK